MREALERYMKVGVVHFMAFPEVMGGKGPLAETLRKIASDDFFQVAEVTHIAGRNVRKEVRCIAQEAGLTLVFGAQPVFLGKRLSLSHEEKAKRAKAVALAKELMDEACELGAKAFAVLAGPDPGRSHRVSARGRLIESLETLSDCALRHQGLMVLLENFDRARFGKNSLIGPTEEAVEVARRLRVSHPNFSLLLDLSHLPLLGETPVEAVRLARGYLGSVHIGNCVMRDETHPAYGDNHPRFGIPEGENGVPEVVKFLRTLLEIGFLQHENPPVVSFEVRPFAGEDELLVLASSKRVLRRAWALV